MPATSLVVDEFVCRIALTDGELELPWRWLRDHARDESSFLPSANQRLVPPDVVAGAGSGSAHLDDDGASLCVTWSDGTAATWPIEWLRATTGDAGTATSIESLAGAARPWRGGDLDERLLRLPAADLADERGLADALRALTRDGVIVVSDLPTDHADTRWAIERFGYVRMTIFGDLWEFRSDGGFDDTASTPMEITPHTDGSYSNDAPGLLALHCHRYEARGGENVFVCGHALSDRIASEAPHLHDLLRTVDVPGQYIGDGAHLMSARPPLRFERGRLAQITYNHHDRAPFRLPEPTMTDLFDALALVHEVAADPDMQFELALRPGDMVVFDNWRVLHGRRAFEGERLIAGGYVNREDVDSTVRRVLAPA
mgnify:CR=1 FL=1